MAKRIFAVSAPKVVDTGSISGLFIGLTPFRHMLSEFDGVTGTLFLRKRDPDELDLTIFDQVVDGRAKSSPLKWYCQLVKGGSLVFYGSIDEDLDDLNLADILQEMQDGILLIESEIKDHLQRASTIAGIRLELESYDGELKTHYQTSELGRLMREQALLA
ncbi:MAG: hypothetical protein HZC02_00420 [Candidatus Levybacteria bacterium]|nr:hypothetical protein [Candidatus Levybacteria bacterium]